MMNSMLRIPTFYPLRDLSKPAPNNHILDYLIRRGLGKALMARLSQEHLPIIATFYAPALIADHHQYQTPIYSVICDADLNRIWVATKPGSSRIFYFAPCGRVMRRLREYGVPDERIFITGFPLPRENIGKADMGILKTDLQARLRQVHLGLEAGCRTASRALEAGEQLRTGDPDICCRRRRGTD
jgi:hypothetical protein